jgi:CRP-like cAMP-binding protein
MEIVSRMMDGSIPYDVESPGGSLLLPGPPISRDEKIEHLQKVAILQHCSRRQLAAIAKITEVFDAPSGMVLTRTGEAGNQFFLIMDGTARVEVSRRKQPRLGPGEYFGEMSLLDGEPRSATVVAETPIRLLIIGRKNFATILNEVPGLIQNILVTLSKRVRQAERPPGY